MRDLFVENYRKLRGQNLTRFWKEVVSDADIVQLLDEDSFIVKETTSTTHNNPSSSSRREWNNPATASTSSESKNSEEFRSDSEPASKMDLLIDAVDVVPAPVDIVEGESQSQCGPAVFENAIQGDPSRIVEALDFKNCLSKSSSATAALQDLSPVPPPALTTDSNINNIILYIM